MKPTGLTELTLTEKYDRDLNFNDLFEKKILFIAAKGDLNNQSYKHHYTQPARYLIDIAQYLAKTPKFVDAQEYVKQYILVTDIDKDVDRVTLPTVPQITAPYACAKLTITTDERRIGLFNRDGESFDEGKFDVIVMTNVMQSVYFDDSHESKHCVLCGLATLLAGMLEPGGCIHTFETEENELLKEAFAETLNYTEHGNTTVWRM